MEDAVGKPVSACDSEHTFRPVVLELAMGLDIGGAETHIVSLSKSLKAMGWDVLVASAGGRRVQDILESGIPHYLVPLHSRNPLDLMRAYRELLNLVGEKMAGDNPINVIHAHARIPAWLATRVARRFKIPLVTTYHWTFVSGFPWNMVTRAGDWTIAVSHDIKDYVVREFGFDPNRVIVVPNGIDCDEFSPKSPDEVRALREAFGIHPGDGPVLVYASRMNDDLSQTACQTIQAVVPLLESHPNLRLLIAGDGDYLGRVVNEAEQVNMMTGRDTVRCLGFVGDMARLYQICDVTIGMSRVVLEAMACGKPAIVAGPQGDYGPVTKENVDHLDIRNFTSRDAPKEVHPQTLAAEIREVLHDPKYHDIGEFGRRYVIDTHSAESTAGGVQAVYFKAMGISDPRPGRE